MLDPLAGHEMGKLISWSQKYLIKIFAWLFVTAETNEASLVIVPIAVT